MVKPDRKKVEKLKKQDELLDDLPSIEKEKKVFSKGESRLEHWAKKRSVKPRRVKTVKKRVKDAFKGMSKIKKNSGKTKSKKR